MEERKLYNNTCFKPMAYEQLFKSFKRKSFFPLVIVWSTNAVRERRGGGGICTRNYTASIIQLISRKCFERSGNEDVPSGLVDIGKGSKKPSNFSRMLANKASLREPKWFNISL